MQQDSGFVPLFSKSGTRVPFELWSLQRTNEPFITGPLFHACSVLHPTIGESRRLRLSEIRHFTSIQATNIPKESALHSSKSGRAVIVASGYREQPHLLSQTSLPCSLNTAHQPTAPPMVPYIPSLTPKSYSSPLFETVRPFPQRIWQLPRRKSRLASELPNRGIKRIRPSAPLNTPSQPTPTKHDARSRAIVDRR